MSYLLVEVLELLILVGPLLEVLDVAGTFEPSLSTSRTIGGITWRTRKTKDARKATKTSEDRQPARAAAPADADPLDPVDGRGQREREEDRGDDPAERRARSWSTMIASSSGGRDHRQRRSRRP